MGTSGEVPLAFSFCLPFIKKTALSGKSSQLSFKSWPHSEGDLCYVKQTGSQQVIFPLKGENMEKHPFTIISVMDCSIFAFGHKYLPHHEITNKLWHMAAWQTCWSWSSHLTELQIWWGYDELKRCFFLIFQWKCMLWPSSELPWWDMITIPSDGSNDETQYVSMVK